jgi:hypothetical protein
MEWIIFLIFWPILPLVIGYFAWKAEKLRNRR